MSLLHKDSISKRKRTQCMRIIQKYLSDSSTNRSLSASQLYNYGLSKSIDAEHMIDVLCGLGFVTSKKSASGNHHLIQLSDKGICYFETLADERRNIILNSFFIPILVAFVTSLLTLYVLPNGETKQDGTSDTIPQSIEISEQEAEEKDGLIENLKSFQEDHIDTTKELSSTPVAFQSPFPAIIAPPEIKVN